VIDCFNKEVIGYAMADHMRTELTRKSDGEWAAEGTRRSRVMWYCCGFGIMRRHR
jgi:hypothetical protein